MKCLKCNKNFINRIDCIMHNCNEFKEKINFTSEDSVTSTTIVELRPCPTSHALLKENQPSSAKSTKEVENHPEVELGLEECNIDCQETNTDEVTYDQHFDLEERYHQLFNDEADDDVDDPANVFFPDCNFVEYDSGTSTVNHEQRLPLKESTGNKIVSVNIENQLTLNSTAIDDELTIISNSNKENADFLNRPVEQSIRTNCTGTPTPKRRKKNPIPVKEREQVKAIQRKENHPVLPPCVQCKKGCTVNISEERRLKLNEMYWNLDAKEKRTFIFGSCEKLQIKRRTTNESKRMNTIKYTFTTENDVVVEVCKRFFLKTLGFNEKNDKIITTVVCKAIKGAISPTNDRRGKAPCKNKGPWEKIEAHIESYHPDISHYRREHAPNTRYLPSDLTVALMHEQFLEAYPEYKHKVSYELYRKILKKMKISFAKLGHEECEKCEEFKLHPHSKDNMDENCDQCKLWEVHINKATDSRKQYQLYSEKEKEEEGTLTVAADLQKIIMLPRIDSFKKVLFLKRLTVFNETFAPVGTKSPHKPFLCLWNEAIRGRNKEEHVSTVFSFLKRNRDMKVINIWLDNCSAQNKNWCLYSFLVFIINSSEISTNEINLWYFEPGHSFMAADSVHHQVELALKKQGKTYDFQDFSHACQSACKGKPEVNEMKIEDFYLWEVMSSQQKLKMPGRVMLADISHVKAKRGLFVLKYKKTYDSNERYKELDFLKKKFMKKGAMNLPSPLSEPSGFPLEKREKLLKELSSIMPESRLTFWKNLPASTL